MGLIPILGALRYNQSMGRDYTRIAFSLSAAVLFCASFIECLAYAGPEPFFEYHRIDAILHIGVSSALIALWIAWSLGIVVAVATRMLGVKWLGCLLIAAVCIFYLILCPLGYLGDLEDYIMPHYQQQK